MATGISTGMVDGGMAVGMQAWRGRGGVPRGLANLKLTGRIDTVHQV